MNSMPNVSDSCVCTVGYSGPPPFCDVVVTSEQIWSSRGTLLNSQYLLRVCPQ